MHNLLKHLKPFVGSMIIAIAFLFVQAICDLSLPDYMSNIVNVGIQQGGVENAVPKVIKSSEMEKLFIFMKDDEKKVVEENYTLLDKNNLNQDEYNKYLKDYPELKNESIYKLDTKKEENLDKLNDIFGKPMIIVSMLELQGVSAVPGIDNTVPQGVDLSTVDPFEMLKMMIIRLNLRGIWRCLGKKLVSLVTHFKLVAQIQQENTHHPLSTVISASTSCWASGNLEWLGLRR